MIIKEFVFLTNFVYLTFAVLEVRRWLSKKRKNEVLRDNVNMGASHKSITLWHKSIQEDFFSFNFEETLV